jgi:hypothetical protein
MLLVRKSIPDVVGGGIGGGEMANINELALGIGGSGIWGIWVPRIPLENCGELLSPMH